MYDIAQLKKLFCINKKYTFKDLTKLLDVDDETLLSDLNTLEEQGIITVLSDCFQALDKNNYATENIRIYKDCGVFYFDNIKYKIHLDDINGSLKNDLCLFVIDKESKKAKVKKIIKRFNDLVVCELMDNKLKIYGDNKYVDVPSNEYSRLVEGSRVLIKLKNDGLNGNIVEIIGHKDDPGIDLIQIALSKCFSLDFSEEYLKELEKFPNHVKEDEIKGRLDLRDKLLYTIDCDNTKDMDDAISVEKKENGNYVLGVHIADVSHYVKLGSEIFKEAFKRGNSLYMLNTVIPMIHKFLSNGICSLNPSVDRLTKSCFMEIDKDGNIVDYKIVKSVIRSKKKMKYSEVNKLLEENKMVAGYEPFIDNLKLANELNNILNKARIERGYVKFMSNDLIVELDKNNKPLEFKMQEQKTAETMIENCMLMANQTVAINYSWLPFIYRIHEMPDKNTVINILQFLKKLGYNIPLIKNVDNQKALQGILRDLSSDKDFKIISNFILRGMKKAKYSTENTGHFALAYEHYTHFTSPIRRLSDLMVHILIDLYEKNNYMINEEIENLEQLLIDVSIQASFKERKAIEAENEANAMKMAEYMEGHINEYFNGKIINIDSSGVTVEVNNIIGHVNFSDIKKDSYKFNKENFTLFGKKTKQTLKIGDNVRIKVLSASKEYRTIDFAICEKLDKVKQKVLIKE
ncbi:MAG TPA: VacB/RNase II family 3'-5' exoribonuclease [Candidatus Faecisoma merdavium]|nr:VacB/RNase II family 3'-5' exoribonuclease [Candidatus Faecisoma merdavium]